MKISFLVLLAAVTGVLCYSFFWEKYLQSSAELSDVASIEAVAHSEQPAQLPFKNHEHPSRRIEEPSERHDDEYEQAKLAFKRMLSLLEAGGSGGMAFFTTEEENVAFVSWSEETGGFIDHPKNSDYGSYDQESLYALAAAGDLRAYSALRHANLEADQLKEVVQLGVVAGSNSAVHESAGDHYHTANSRLENGDTEGYKQSFAEQLALFELYEMRGGFLPSDAKQRIINGYQLDDVGDVQKLAKARTPEIIKEINQQRSRIALDPLNLEPPDVVLRANAMKSCGADKQCLAEYLPPDFF